MTKSVYIRLANSPVPLSETLATALEANDRAAQIIATMQAELKANTDAETARQNGNGHKDDTNIKGRP